MLFSALSALGSLFVTLGVCARLVAGEASSSPASPALAELVLSNEFLRIEFDSSNGKLVAVDNLAKGLSLLPPGSRPCGPPLVDLVEARTPRIESFRFEWRESAAGNPALWLEWQLQKDIRVELRVELPSGSEMAFFWPTVLNAGEESLKSMHYPVFADLPVLGDSSADDVLVHAFVRGMKVRDPRHTLDTSHNPIESARYPQAYNGLTHQLIDYYSEGHGGFFFASFDPHSTEKTIDMPVGKERLGMSWRYHAWDHRPGADLQFDFPFVLGANTTGDWYRAADHYRDWAVTTEWCQSAGPVATRDEDRRARWLYEDVGLATFGTAASLDQSFWYQAYHDVAGTPVFHVTAVDSLREEGRGGDPYDLVVELHPANRATFERNGDYAAIFLADLKTNFLPNEIAYEVGRLTEGVVPRASPEACPSTRLWRYLHALRATGALTQTSADSFYHDASAPNRNLSCESLEHGHPPGRGRWMVAAFRELYASTRAQLGKTCGSYTPIGVELMHEGLIDRFDYYQARNGAGFMGGLEGGFYRSQTLDGMIETVPVFAYLFHDYAPVALDGCGKLSERLGDVFYWMASRVALAGGIFEINNEFSPTERFPGASDVGVVHYRKDHFFDWVGPDNPANSPYDPAKGAFVREIAAARTDFARDFLAYGRMLPPLAVRAGKVALGYGYYNNIDWGGKPNSLEFSDKSGEFETSAVVHTAWKAGDRLGLLFVNLDDEERVATVDFDLARYADYGLEFSGEVEGRRISALGVEALRWTAGGERELRLPPRRVVLLELRAE